MGLGLVLVMAGNLAVGLGLWNGAWGPQLTGTVS